MEGQRRDLSQEEENSEDSDNLEGGTWYFKEESVALEKTWEKTFEHGASSSVHLESHKNTEATWDHYFHTTPDTSYKEAVFSMLLNFAVESNGRENVAELRKIRSSDIPLYQPPWREDD